jgi:hypothetical protein
MSAPFHSHSVRAPAPPSSSTETLAWSKFAVSIWYHIAHDA